MVNQFKGPLKDGGNFAQSLFNQGLLLILDPNCEKVLINGFEFAQPFFRRPAEADFIATEINSYAEDIVLTSETLFSSPMKEYNNFFSLRRTFHLRYFQIG